MSEAELMAAYGLNPDEAAEIARQRGGSDDPVRPEQQDPCRERGDVYRET